MNRQNLFLFLFFFFSSRRRHTRLVSDWSSDVCSSDLSADLLQAFGTNRAAVMAGRYRDFKFWKSDPAEAAARGEVEQQQRAVDEEMGEIGRASCRGRG